MRNRKQNRQDAMKNQPRMVFHRNGQTKKLFELLVHSLKGRGAHGAERERAAATSPVAQNPLMLTSARLHLETNV